MLSRAGSTRANWLTAKPSLKILGQRLGRVIAPRRILFQTLQGNGGQIRTALRRKEFAAYLQGVESLRAVRRDRRLFLYNLAEQRGYALRLERRLLEQ